MFATIPPDSMGSPLEMANQLSMVDRRGTGPMDRFLMSARWTIQAVALVGLNISLSLWERLGHS